MPIMNGIVSAEGIFKAIANHNLTKADADKIPAPKVVALTAYQGEGVRADCLRVGMSEVYNKPMAFEELHGLIWRDFFSIGEDEYKEKFFEQFEREYER